MEDLVSIIIPSRNEKYLETTIKDLLAKATGPIEIIVMVNGGEAEYQPKGRESWDNAAYIDERGVKYLDCDAYGIKPGMKYCINAGVGAARGKYIMKIDGHCIVAPGFDAQLKKDHQPNWIQIPRRYKLNESEWRPAFEQPPVDYEYWIYPPKYPTTSLHGFNWKERTENRKDILIDDTLTFQGSFWFMTREWWDKMDFMNDEGYNQLHAQEAAYIGTATWMAGGRVVTNKNTWYAHLYKTKQAGRGYHMDDRNRRRCYKYSYKHWVTDNKEGFIKLIDKFWPLPGWPADWKEKLWNN